MELLLFQIEKGYLHAGLILYLVWCSYSTILFHQVFISSATYVEAFGKVENRFKTIYFFQLKILKPKLIDSYKWTDLAIVRHSSGPIWFYRIVIFEALLP